MMREQATEIALRELINTASATLADVKRLRAERDELLVAIKRLMLSAGAVGDLLNQRPYRPDSATELEALDDIMAEAQAAVVKAEVTNAAP